MRVLLVRTGRRKQAITLGEFMYAEPLGLECVYALLKDDHALRVLDLMTGEEDFLTVCRQWRPEAIGLTSLCIDVQSVLLLAQQAKAWNPAVITMVGGTQSYLAPESFYADSIDHVFQYTTRTNVKKLLHCLAYQQDIPLIDGVHSRCNQYQATAAAGINDLIVPDRSSTAKYRRHYSYFGYKPCAIMQTSRGCSGRCHFCLRWHIEGCTELDEPLEAVLAQIKQIPEENIMILDNDFLHSEARLASFCDMLERENIHRNFICYGSVRSITSHPETITRFGRLGLRAVLVGYESFQQNHLDEYNKQTTVADNLRTGEILRKAGIDCWASFILHPDWNRKDFKSFRRFMKRLRPQITSLVPMTPFPGSLLEKKYTGRIIHQKEDYDQWSFSTVSIQPGQMSLRGYYWEVLRTNLFVNLLLNNPAYMIRKFGFATIARLAKGSTAIIRRYIVLMAKS